MPELPEVETVARAMQRALPGRRIVRVATSGKRLRQPLPRARLRALCGRRFAGARRRAKYLLLDLDSGESLLVHLGMSGNLLLRPPGRAHDHVVFYLEGERPLVFNDPRRFGMVLVLRQGEEENCPYLSRLGVDPLAAAFDARYLGARCQGRTRPIKNALMDGRLVAGIGNIYASEALFAAGIHPLTAAGALDARQCRALVRAVKQVLRRAVRQGGTTIADYLGTGAGGRFQQQLRVYGRAGQPCRRCGTPIRSQALAGRSTFYCPQCQK